MTGNDNLQQPSPASSSFRAATDKLRKVLFQDTKRLFSTGVFHFFLALLGTQGIAFIRRIFLANFLEVSEMGQLTYVMRIADLIAIFADLGICTAVLKFAAEPVSEKRKEEIYGAGLMWGAISSIIIALVYMGATFSLSMGSEESLRVFMLMVIPYIPLQAMAKTPILFMQARKEIKRAANYTIFTQGLSLLFVVTATYYFGLWGFFATVVIAPLSNFTLLLWVTRKSLRWVKPTMHLFKELMHFGFFSMLANTVGFANITLSVFLLKELASGDDDTALYAVGLFGIASTISMGFRLLPRALMQVAFPYLSGLMNDPVRLRKRLMELAIKQGLVVVGCVVFWFFAGETLIGWVFSDKYVPGFNTSLILVAALIPFAIHGPFAQAFMVIGKVKLNFLIGTVTLLTNVLFCFFWIPKWNSIGAAWATFASQIIAALLTLFLSKFYLRKSCLFE